MASGVNYSRQERGSLPAFNQLPTPPPSPVVREGRLTTLLAMQQAFAAKDFLPVVEVKEESLRDLRNEIARATEKITIISRSIQLINDLMENQKRLDTVKKNSEVLKTLARKVRDDVELFKKRMKGITDANITIKKINLEIEEIAQLLPAGDVANSELALAKYELELATYKRQSKQLKEKQANGERQCQELEERTRNSASFDYTVQLGIITDEIERFRAALEKGDISDPEWMQVELEHTRKELEAMTHSLRAIPLSEFRLEALNKDLEQAQAASTEASIKLMEQLGILSSLSNFLESLKTECERSSEDLIAQYGLPEVLQSNLPKLLEAWREEKEAQALLEDGTVKTEKEQARLEWIVESRSWVIDGVFIEMKNKTEKACAIFSKRVEVQNALIGELRLLEQSERAVLQHAKSLRDQLLSSVHYGFLKAKAQSLEEVLK